MNRCITYCIANHYFGVEGESEVDLLQSLPGFPLFLCDTCQQSEWLVRFGSSIVFPTDYEILYVSYDDEEAFHFSFVKADDAFYFSMNDDTNQESPLLMRFQQGSIVEATHCFDATILRFALWIAFGMLSASSSMVLIHSSVIVHQNKAVLFLGESGTGKSTHTRLWLNHIPDSHLLNDDSPILSIENGIPVVYGSPWSGKNHCYHPLHFPLAAAVRLSQAPYNKISRQSVLGAFVALQPSCPPSLAQDDYFSNYIISLLNDVINSVPVYRLECLPDAAAAHLSHDTIFDSL